jgi:hypothetical protein
MDEPPSQASQASLHASHLEIAQIDPRVAVLHFLWIAAQGQGNGFELARLHGDWGRGHGGNNQKTKKRNLKKTSPKNKTN